MKRILAIAAAFTVFTYSHVVLAASPSPGAGWVPGVSATGQTIWFGPGTQTKLSAQMGQAVWDSVVTSTGGAKLTTTAKLAVGAGEAAVVAKGVATGANIFGAFRAAVGGPAGLALLAAPSVINWLLAENIRSKPGTTQLEKLKEGPGYKIDQYVGTTQKDACDAFTLGNYPSNEAESFSGSVSGTQCAVTEDYHPKPPAVGWTDVIARVEIATTPNAPADPTKPENWLPKSMDDIAPYMSPRPASPAFINDLLNNGGEIPITTPSVTGPATVTAPSVVSTSNDGTNTTTSTTTTKSTQTYSTGSPSTGAPTVPKVTSTTNTTTIINVVNNSSGNVVSTTTNTTNNPTNPGSLTPDETPPEDYTFTNAEFGPIPKLYERKYPDGIKGVWDEKIIAIKASPLFTLVDSLMPTNIASSGTCPSFMIPVNFGQWGEYGNLDFSPPCFVWDFGKVIIIISALLLSRRLIFGG